MGSRVSRVLLGCVLACCAGALAIALGASGAAGAVVTAVVVVGTLLSVGRSATPAARQPWHPVQVVTRAALFAVAVTAGAALVAYSLNQPADVDPPRASTSSPDVEVPRAAAPGATLTPLPASPSPEAPPSAVEEALSEEPTPAEPTPSEEPTAKPREPKPTPSPEPKPTPSPEPTPTPTPTPTPDDPGLCGGLLGILCP